MRFLFFLPILIFLSFFTACIAPSEREQTTESQIEAIAESISESQQEGNSPEPSHEEDGGTVDAHPFSQLPCNEVVKAFQAFYEKHNDCEVDEDCRYSAYTLPYGGDGCSCILSVSKFPVPIPKKYQEYGILESRFHSHECRVHDPFDCSMNYMAEPKNKLICKNGFCSQYPEEDTHCGHFP
jgi:hypothetical protein